MGLKMVDCRLKMGGPCGALLAVTLCVGVPAAFSGEVIDRVLAIAAGNIITLTDVNAARAFRLVPVDAAGDGSREILSRLIERSLILAEVERYAPPEPDGRAVAMELQAIRARFPTQEAFEKALAGVGFDESHLADYVRENLRIRAYLEQRFTVAPLSEDEIARYYREHMERWTRDGQVLPLADVRDDVVAAATATRRQRSIDQWASGLRRRAEVVDLSLSAR
jgi:hypothetical protein